MGEGHICKKCGLINPREATFCSKCSAPLSKMGARTASEQAQVKNQVQAAQIVICGIGFLGSAVLAFATFFLFENLVLFGTFFIGILAVGMLLTWVVASLVERKLTGGNKIEVTTSEKISVSIASFVVAALVFRSTYGFIISPILAFGPPLLLFLFYRKK